MNQSSNDLRPEEFDQEDELRVGHIKKPAEVRTRPKIGLKDLRALGGFVSAVPVKKDVEWTHHDPETGDEVTDKFSVFVKRQSFGAIERLFVGNDDQSKSATFISECILLGDEGKDRMTYQDAYQLDPGLAAVLVKAINEVNHTDKAAAKN